MTTIENAPAKEKPVEIPNRATRRNTLRNVKLIHKKLIKGWSVKAISNDVGVPEGMVEDVKKFYKL